MVPFVSSGLGPRMTDCRRFQFFVASPILSAPIVLSYPGSPLSKIGFEAAHSDELPLLNFIFDSLGIFLFSHSSFYSMITIIIVKVQIVLLSKT